MMSGKAATGRRICSVAVSGAAPSPSPFPASRPSPQARENADAMAFGPLSDRQMAEIDALLDRQAPT
jgi:hypothetical protein